MKIKSTDSIYQVIEEALNGVTTPQTCVDLMNNPVIRAAAMKRFNADLQLSTNKLSDTLGFMWRRGLLQRYPSSDQHPWRGFHMRSVNKRTLRSNPSPHPPALLINLFTGSQKARIQSPSILKDLP